MKFFLTGLVFTICGFFGYAQQQFSITGTVYDADSKNPLHNAIVKLSQKQYKTDNKGGFVFNTLSRGTYFLEFSMPGYDDMAVTVDITDAGINMNIPLEKKTVNIAEVKISHKSKEDEAKEQSAVMYEITKDYLDDNRENTLMQSLQNLPGIQAMSVGSGQSKPVIRGLGFNRVVVSQHGIKHEAQQWGNDHGLEIDQNDVGSVQIVRGPVSILYGSDAIGGVVNLSPLPVKYGFSGTANLLAESNNDLLGATLGVQSRKGKWYYRGRITWNDYGDYKVPADKIVYDNYVFALHNHNLRNTAGTEKDAGFSIGFAGENFKTETFVSNVNLKSGFFANAHGLEVRTSDIDYDASNRDIDLPYHSANHFKIINNTSFTKNNHKIKLNTAFQNNYREEHSEAVAHGYMPKPDGTLERRYVKNTYTAEIQDEVKFSERHSLTTGINTEYQHNTIGGWGFLIPAYTRLTAGMYAYNKFEIHQNLFFHSGLRYDAGTVRTKAYYDWYPSAMEHGNSYVQRAEDSRRNFNNISAAAGFSYIKGNYNYKINAGKSFRMPLASELSSDGVNYHMFRYEKGNISLKAETSYQLDAEVSYEKNGWHFSLTPFINYFDNYIYLNPTARYYESLQIYEYMQSKVLRAGGELNIGFQLLENLDIDASAEYVISRQKSGAKKNFPLPFSPPLRGLFSAKYSFGKVGFMEDFRLKADFHLSAKQTDIVPPEQITNGFAVLDMALMTDVNLFEKKENNPKLRLKLNNVLNKKYFDNLSFYRIIEVPQPGRNVSVSLTVPF